MRRRTGRMAALGLTLTMVASLLGWLGPAPAQATTGRVDLLIQNGLTTTSVSYRPDNLSVALWPASTQVYLFDLATGYSGYAPLTNSGAMFNAAVSNLTLRDQLILFASNATNLGPGSNGYPQVFVRDRASSSTTLGSATSTGGFPSAPSTYVDSSRDGRFLLFTTSATNVVPEDTTPNVDVFLRDRVAGTTTLVNLAPDGSHPTMAAPGAISGDGRYWVFADTAGTWGTPGVKRMDLTTRAIAAVDTSASYGSVAAVSHDGRWVVVRRAGNLYRVDVDSGSSTLVTQRPDGSASPTTAQPANASISDDGRAVAFVVSDQALTGEASATGTQLYARDLALGRTEWLSRPDHGTATQTLSNVHIAPDGASVLVMTTAALSAADIDTSLSLFRVQVSLGSATVAGTVRDATSGVAVAGAVVEVYDPGSARFAVVGKEPKPRFTVTTGSDGTYSTALPPGPYALRVVGPSGQGYGATFEGGLTDRRAATSHLLVADAVQSVDFALPRLSTFGGVTSAASEPGAWAATRPVAFDVTPDGRHMAIQTKAILDPADTTTNDDVYVVDLTTGVARLVSRNISGHPTYFATYLAGVSDDGTVVAVTNFGNDMVPPGANYLHNALVVDLITGEVTDLYAMLGEPTARMEMLAVSGNGRVAAFRSVDSLGGGAYRHKLRVIDRRTGAVSVVSEFVASSANDLFYRALLSHDGTTIAWSESNLNGMMGVSSRRAAVVVKDLADPGETVVTEFPAGASPTARLGALSADGSHLVYDSSTGAADGGSETYSFDRVTAQHDLVSVTADGFPASSSSEALDTSPDGRFVLFKSYDGAVAPGAPYNLGGGSGGRTYLRDRQTGEVEWIDVPRPPEVGLQDVPASMDLSGRVWFPGDPKIYVDGVVSTSRMIRTQSKLLTRTLDPAPPSVTCAASPTAWSAADVSVDCSVDDATRLPVGVDAEVPARTHVAAGTSDPSAVPRSDWSVCTIDGACARPVAGDTARVDRVAPTATISSPSADTVLVAGQAAQVGYSCSDDASGVATCTGPVPDGASFVPTTPGPATFDVHVVDTAGNESSASVAYTVVPASDPDPPDIDCGEPPTGWSAQDATVTCTASDESGLADPGQASFTLSTATPAGTEDAAASTSQVSVCDVYDNCRVAGPFQPIKVDRRPPSIAMASPTAAQVVVAGRVTAQYECSDGGSGVATCAGETGSGQVLDTSPGPHVLNVAASDAVGNQSSTSRAYTVVAAVTGKVVDASTGSGQGGVQVRFYPHGSSTMTGYATTVADGTYSMAVLPPGSYDVQVSRAGTHANRWLPRATARTDAVPVAIGESAAVVNGAIVPVGFGEVVGRVTTETGVVVAGAAVSLYVPGAGSPTASVTTAPDGTYVMPARAVGLYEVQVVKAGREVRWWPDAQVRWRGTPLSLAAPSTTADFRLPPSLGPDGSIVGTVTDAATGLPVGDVSVRLWKVGTQVMVTYTSTGSDGRFGLNVPEPGLYQIQYAKGPAYQTRWWSRGATRDKAATIDYLGVAARADATMVAVGKAEISGLVTDGDTRVPLAGATVSAYLPGGATPVATVQADASGRYAMAPMPQGTYEVSASAEAHVTTWWKTSSSRANATPLAANGIVTADIVLPGDPNMPGTVSGVVTDGTTGAPVAGVSVRLWTVGTQSYTYVSTDSAGRYRMTGVPAGRYQLQCAKPGRATTWWSGATSRATARIIDSNGAAIHIDPAMTP